MKTKSVNKRFEQFDIYIGRGSAWGNPFTHLPVAGTKASHQVKDRAEAMAKYREWITEGDGKHLLTRLHELKGKRLGCYCSPHACHGDILAELADK